MHGRGMFQHYFYNATLRRIDIANVCVLIYVAGTRRRRKRRRRKRRRRKRRRRDKRCVLPSGAPMLYYPAHAIDRQETADTGEKEIALNYIRRAGQR